MLVSYECICVVILFHDTGYLTVVLHFSGIALPIGDIL